MVLSRPSSEQLNLMRDEEEVKPVTEIFTFKDRYEGVTENTLVLEVALNSSEDQSAFLDWKSNVLQALFDEITRVNKVQELWRLQIRGDQEVHIMQLPYGQPNAQVVFERTLFQPLLQISKDTNQEHIRTRLRSDSRYGSMDQSVSLPKDNDWQKSHVILERQSFKIIYPTVPIDIDGEGRHFIVATKKDRFKDLTKEEFALCLESVQKVVRIFQKIGDKLCILAGGEVSGVRACKPWHMEVIVYKSNSQNDFVYNSPQFQRRSVPKNSIPFEDKINDIRNKVNTSKFFTLEI